MVFPLEVSTAAAQWPEQSERKRKWFPASKAAGLVQEQDLGELIERFGKSRHKIAA
jgi:hypothetical protein